MKQHGLAWMFAILSAAIASHSFAADPPTAKPSATPSETLTSQEKTIGTMPTKHSRPFVSPDGSRVAFFTPKKGFKYHMINMISFGGSSTVPGYFVVDDYTSERFGRVAEPVFSPDGKHFVLAAGAEVVRDVSVDNPGAEWIILDGEKQAAFDSVESIAFSPDGDHLAYAAHRDGKSVVVLDGETIDQQDKDDVVYVSFTPVGSEIVSIRGNRNAWRVVIGSKQSDAYEVVIPPVFSRDGKRMAFRASRDKIGLLVVDWKEQASHRRISEPIFGPNGEVAYWAGDDKTDVLLIDGVERDRSDLAKGFLGDWFPGSIAFSDDGKVVGHTAQRDKKNFVVTNDSVVEHDDAHPFGVKLSPDGQRMTYALLRDHLIYAVVDGRETPTNIHCPTKSMLYLIELDQLVAPRLSPAGGHVSYLRNVSDCKEYWRCSRGLKIVIDGGSSQGYDEVLRTWWESEDSLKAVARRDDEFLLVELHPPAG